MKEIDYQDLLVLWGNQELLLQTYRTIFIGMQSIFVAIGSYLAQDEKAFISLAAITVMAFFALWLWVTICRVRGQSVYLVQYLALKAENGEVINKPLEILKHFQDFPCLEIRRDAKFIALANGATRKKMEVWLPVLFGLVWTCLWTSIVFRYFEVVPL